MRNKRLKRIVRKRERRELNALDAVIPTAVAFASCCGRDWRARAHGYYFAMEAMASRRLN